MARGREGDHLECGRKSVKHHHHWRSEPADVVCDDKPVAAQAAATVARRCIPIQNGWNRVIGEFPAGVTRGSVEASLWAVRSVHEGRLSMVGHATQTQDAYPGA